MRSLPAYLQIVNMGIQMIAAYRVQAILETASMLLQVFLLRAIWEAVYAGQNQLDGRPLSLVIAYVTIATIQNWLLSPNLAYFLAELVRDGSVGIELVRPVPFLGRLLAQQGVKRRSRSHSPSPPSRWPYCWAGCCRLPRLLPRASTW